MRSALVAALIFGSSQPASARLWIAMAQDELTCTSWSDQAERDSLQARWLPTVYDSQSIHRFFANVEGGSRDAKFKHLTALAAVGWWADRVNDQGLRADVYATISELSSHYATKEDELLFRQIARCAYAQMIVSAVAMANTPAANALAGRLADLYAAASPEQPVEDQPLLLALSEIRLEPRARPGVEKLAALARRIGAAAEKIGQRDRSSRLWAAVGQAMFATGDKKDALNSAGHSTAVAGKPPTQVAWWRALPTMYDVMKERSGAMDAAGFRDALDSETPPDQLYDRRIVVETLQRLAEMAQTKGHLEDWIRLRTAAHRELAKVVGNGASISFLRHALAASADGGDTSMRDEARRDPQFAAQTLATYTAGYETLLQNAQRMFVSDARARLLERGKYDNFLSGLAQLHEAAPRGNPKILDLSFRLAQLRSFGRLTLATQSAALARASIPPEHRFNVERFFSLSTQTSFWLRGLMRRLGTRASAPLPAAELLSESIAMLDVFNLESQEKLPTYIEFVRRNAPELAELATPKPLAIGEFQRRLRTGEAVVATGATADEVFVWVLTSTAVTLARKPIPERDLHDLVQRLRAGLTPGRKPSDLPPFDAESAFELYSLVFGSVAEALRGTTDVIWFGDGPLGAIPPAVLVTSKPKAKLLKTPEEFAATSFLVDRFAFSALADLSLFPVERDRLPPRGDGGRFLGVGAPLLAANEVDGSTRSSSYELAGGLEGKQLAELPKLAESVDEIRGIAAIVGEENSTVWLGPEADEHHFEGDKLRDYQTIVLATHGFLPDEVRNVPEPALMLALKPDSTNRFDGILTSHEIAALNLDANLVVLSACNTASADGRPHAEAFTGLSQAFFAAGARSLMVSHWPVMSGAAVGLTVGTLERHRKRGLPLGRSLQQAVQELRKSGAQNVIESHPSYWGPFVVVGDAR